jgi:hypothetical protein
MKLLLKFYIDKTFVFVAVVVVYGFLWLRWLIIQLGLFVAEYPLKNLNLKCVCLTTMAQDCVDK